MISLALPKTWNYRFLGLAHTCLSVRRYAIGLNLIFVTDCSVIDGGDLELYDSKI